jgi:hypothetical protein
VGIALESCGKVESEQRCQPHLISGHHGPLRRPTGVTSEGRELSVTTVLLQGREPSVLTDSCREKCGVVLGRGIGDLQGRAFRVAHMGHVSAPTVFGVLGAIEMEMALKALDLPHGRGGLHAEYLGREDRLSV